MVAIGPINQDEATPPQLLDEELGQLRVDLYRFAAATTRDQSTAEDVVQETFLELARAHHIKDIRNWCFAVAANKMRSHFRRRWPWSLEMLRRSDRLTLTFSPQSDARLDVHAALGRLDPEPRLELLLHVLGGLTYAEIAAIRGETEAAVRQRVYRARIAFRKAFEGAEP
jgi:RNA polymerase sigma-70 factor (ECF subfamily)